MTRHESNVFFIYGAISTAIEYWKHGAQAEGLLHDLEKLIEADKENVDLVTEPEKVDTEKL